MIPPGARILLRAAAVDFRRGAEGLVSLVRDAGADPFDGSVYVFRAKRADRIKIVWWDGSGFACLRSVLNVRISAGQRPAVTRSVSVTRKPRRSSRGWTGNGFARWTCGRRRAPVDGESEPIALKVLEK